MHKVVISGLDTNSLPKLTAKESNELLEQIRKGNRMAKDKFVLANVRLVLAMVQRFGSRGSADDLFQVGMIGLMKAIEGFDPQFNVKFSTYAVPMIQGEIRRHLKEDTGIKVSRSLRDIAYKALKAKEIYETQHCHAPSVMEVAAEIDVPVGQVVHALDAVSDTVSLQEKVYSDGEDGMLLMEQLGDAKQTEERWTDRIAIDQAMRELPEKEKTVLWMRYYVGKTQTEISDSIGISQAQVSRLEKNAIGKLRAYL